jgi:hypothetical protein
VSAATAFLDGVRGRFGLELTAGLWPDMEFVGEYLKALD